MFVGITIFPSQRVGALNDLQVYARLQFDEPRVLYKQWYKYIDVHNAHLIRFKRNANAVIIILIFFYLDANRSFNVRLNIVQLKIVFTFFAGQFSFCLWIRFLSQLLRLLAVRNQL